MYLTPPLKGFPWNFVSAQGSEETRVMGLSGGRKRFQVGLAVLIKYRSVTDTQPATQPPKPARHVAVKYLGLYLIGGADFKIDLTAAKRKYYGCFNTIMSVVGNQVNEIMALHLVKSYCLPQLMYGCEIWPLNSVTIREIDVIWNNWFR